MKVFVNAKRGPLVDVPPALQPRRFAELQQAFAANGLALSDEVNDDGSLHISLSNLAPYQRENVIELLDSLGVCRVDLEAQDLEKLNGSPNVLTHAAGRGIESGAEVITKHTTQLTPDEIFEAVHKASDAVMADHAPAELVDLLRNGISEDLQSAGLISGDDYPNSMDAYDARLRAKNSPEPRELRGEFADNQPPAYKSPFPDEF